MELEGHSLWAKVDRSLSGHHLIEKSINHNDGVSINDETLKFTNRGIFLSNSASKYVCLRVCDGLGAHTNSQEKEHACWMNMGRHDEFVEKSIVIGNRWWGRIESSPLTRTSLESYDRVLFPTETSLSAKGFCVFETALWRRRSDLIHWQCPPTETGSWVQRRQKWRKISHGKLKKFFSIKAMIYFYENCNFARTVN